MKKFFLSIFYIITFCTLAFADSDKFQLDLYAPDTILSSASIYIGDDLKVYIANNTESAQGYISNNGSLIIDNYAVGIGKNYLSLSADSSSFMLSVPWSVESGFLKLYDNDFHAVPSGKNGIYVLGNANAHSGQDDVIPVAIKAVEISSSSTTTIQSFVATNIGSTISFSVLDLSQTFKTSNGATKTSASFLYFFMTLLTYFI